MRRWILVLAPVAATLAFFVYSRGQNAPQGAGAAPAAPVAIRITFGVNADRETDYSGTLALSEGRVRKLIPSNFFGGDQVNGTNGWKLTTQAALMENQPDEPAPLSTPGARRNVVISAVTAVVDAPHSASATVRTAHGTYKFRLDDLDGGRMLDFDYGDVTVQAVPAPVRVSPFYAATTIQEADHPSVAIAHNGEGWSAWQVYRDGGDQVLVAHSTASGWSAPTALTPAGQDVFHTAIAQDARGRVWAVWSQRSGEDWDLTARVWDGRAWSAARKLTGANHPNIFHKLVRDRQGNLHLVWVGYQNAQSHVLWSKLSGDTWSAPQEISGASAWMPDAAADSQGNLYVAWDSYRNGNYDIYARRIAADGSLGELMQVTRSPRFQAHASVAVDKNDRLWLAWDESDANWGKDWNRDDTWRGTTLYNKRHPKVAVLENGKWMQPASDPESAVPERYNRFVENPKLMCDGSGRMWLRLQVRTSTTNNRSDFWSAGGRWHEFLTAYEGDRWRAAAPLADSSTRPDGAFEMAPAAQGVWAVWANDNRLFPASTGRGGRGGEGRKGGRKGGGRKGGQAGSAGGVNPNLRHYDIEFARGDYPGAGAVTPAAPVLTAYEESMAGEAPLHPHEREDVAQIRGYRMQGPEGELRILRGDFHRHTEISSDGAGDGSLNDYFRYMMDAAAMDTGIVSDHSAGGEEYSWWRTEKAIDLYHIPGGYTPLFGYERSVPYPNGHRNVVFDHRGVKVLPISMAENRGQANTGPILYPYLKQNRGVCMEHSLATSQGTDWRDNDPEVEPLVEIYQGYHAAYEYAGGPRAEAPGYLVTAHGAYEPKGFYWNALAKGYKLGTESSSDHISTHSSYTMIYTPTTGRHDIVESMRKRHAYGATDNIVVDYTARDSAGRRYMMGDSFSASAALVLHVKVLGTGEIKSIEIVKDGTFVYKTEPHTSTAEFDFTDRSTKPGTSWYYVRVIQEDRNLAWSSPIWVKYQ